jgi:hypothetical protein
MNPTSGPGPEGVGHEGFPAAGEGLHWLRWIDGVDLRGRGTGSPTVHAYLSPLPPGPRGAPLPPVRSLAAERGARPYAVHAGTLPLLRLGTVFEAGVAIGSLPTTPRTFAFKRSKVEVARRRRFDESPAEKPPWWKYAFATLPQRAYALEGVGDGHCLVLTAGTTQLILPASEVFRVFLAPEPRMADALLSGPWEIVGRRVVNESWTERLPDHWEIGLRTGFTGASALPAAAIELTGHGRAVADLVHAAVVRSRAPLRSLEADIPYEWTVMELDVEGLRFPEQIGRDIGLDRFIALRIVAVRWPLPPRGLPARLTYRLDNYNVEHADPTTPEGRGPSVPRYGAPSPAGTGGDVPLTPDQAPTPLAASFAIDLAITPILGGPVLERMALTGLLEVQGPRRRTHDAGMLPSVSTGRGTFRGTGAAPVRTVADDEAAATGTQWALAAALDELVGVDPGMVEWLPLAPVDDRFEVRGSVPVWLVPGWLDRRRRAWSYLSGGRRRSVLVAAVTTRAGLVHVIDVERRRHADGRDRDATSLLLMEPVPGEEQAAVTAALRGLAEAGGSWPNTVPGTRAHARRPHPFTDAVSPGGRRLDAGRLLAMLGRFLARRAGTMELG